MRNHRILDLGPSKLLILLVPGLETGLPHYTEAGSLPCALRFLCIGERRSEHRLPAHNLTTSRVWSFEGKEAPFLWPRQCWVGSLGNRSRLPKWRNHRRTVSQVPECHLHAQAIR